MNVSKSKFFTVIALLVIVAQLLAACGPASQVTPQVPSGSTEPIATQPPAATPQPQLTAGPSIPVTGKTDPLVFQRTMRKLWEDHVTWTRIYIIDVAAGLPETDATAQRLLQNQVDIGDAIKPFYGDQAGEQLTSLLKDHILTAADLLAAAKSGDTSKFDAANKRWYDNANQIADFLNKANPDNWPLDDLQMMMKSHLDLTLDEATARLKGNWDDDVAAYDKVHKEILEMADALAQGIMKQFPDKFAAQQTSQEQADLALAMDKLWEDHITWTRVYIISATSHLGDTDVAAKRLLQNQSDIGEAIKTYYGDDAGNQLTSLLKDHIMGAVDILAAAKAGDNAKLEDAKTKWYDNANQIADFLSSANEANWPKADMEAMMKSHLDLTLEEATARLQGVGAADIAAYDKVHEEILDMSDMLTKGIVAQFPDQFK